MYKTKNKRNKKHKRTRKYYGGSPPPATVNTNSGAAFKSNEGVFNILGNKLSGFASSALNYIEEKIKYALDNKEEIGKKGREWVLKHCNMKEWIKTIKTIII